MRLSDCHGDHNWRWAQSKLLDIPLGSGMSAGGQVAKPFRSLQWSSSDEHMGISYMTFQKSLQFSWKELLSRIKQAHDQVNANLSLPSNLDDTTMLSFPLLLVELRYHME